jgi:hypothetical protein
MPEESEALIPYAESTIGEAVLAVELWSRAVHSAQRLLTLDRLAVPERVAALMRDVNRSLSAPDEHRDRAYGRRANELLRNSAVKGHLASFLAVEGQIERLAAITLSQGEIDRTLSDPAFLRTLDANQLIALQRSQHTQMLELLAFLEKKKYDGLAQVTSLLTVQTQEEIKSGFTELGKLKPGGRELVGSLLNKILTNLATRRETEKAVAAELTDAASASS